MKKITLLAVSYFLFSHFAAIAQPTLSSGSLLQIGAQYDTRSFLVSNINQGASGQNLTWDFSALTGATEHNLQVRQPESTPFADTFQDIANLSLGYTPAAQQGSFPITFEFWNTTSAGVDIMGLTNTQNIIVLYSDPLTALPLPFSYGNTFTDTFAATYTVGNQTIVQSGVVDIQADGYGNLILPYGTIEDVLRLKITKTYTEQVQGTTAQFDYVVTSYAWYDTSISYPLFNITVEQVQGSPVSVTTAQYIICESCTNTPINATLVSPATFALQTIPNPVQQQATIRFTLPVAEEVSLTIYNTAGQAVQTPLNGYHSAGNHSVAFNSSSLAQGIYLANLTVGKQHTYQKIIVQ